MPSIIFDRFELGIDLRKGESVADANRLRDLKNAYINSGWSIKKRPGLTKIGELSAGTVGLSAFDGGLHTFSAIQAPTHGSIGGLTISNHRLINPDDETLDIQRVYYAKPFNGALYVVAEYTDNSIKHHYLATDPTWAATTAYSLGDYVSPDAGTGEAGLRYKCTTAGTSGGTEPTWPTALADTVSDGSAVWTAVTTAVDDENCPHSNAVIAVAQKLWAVDGDVVRFSATDDPWDWTTASDAGYLPTGLRAPGADEALALGEFNGQLVVIMADSAQVWAVDPDPTNNALSKTISNVGSRYPQSVHPVGDDLFFLAPVGFRSIAVQQWTSNFEDLDVGTPIDDLVRPSLTSSINPRATYYPGGGQYWCIIGSRIWVYSFSRTSKISAWSYYDYPFDIEYTASLADNMYARSGDVVYLVDDNAYTDDGTKYEVLAKLPYQSFKKPGILKQVVGCDFVLDGAADIQHMFNSNDETKVTTAVKVSGDTRPTPLIPVEVMTTELAPKITNYDDEDFRLDAITYYYETIGPF